MHLLSTRPDLDLSDPLYITKESSGPGYDKTLPLPSSASLMVNKTAASKG